MHSPIIGAARQPTQCTPTTHTSLSYIYGERAKDLRRRCRRPAATAVVLFALHAVHDTRAAHWHHASLYFLHFWRHKSKSASQMCFFLLSNCEQTTRNFCLRIITLAISRLPFPQFSFAGIIRITFIKQKKQFCLIRRQFF